MNGSARVGKFQGGLASGDMRGGQEMTGVEGSPIQQPCTLFLGPGFGQGGANGHISEAKAYMGRN